LCGVPVNTSKGIAAGLRKKTFATEKSARKTRSGRAATKDKQPGLCRERRRSAGGPGPLSLAATVFSAFSVRIIEAGKLADAVIISQDLFKPAVNEIGKTKALVTIV
jgi:hypothetical protein